MCTKVAHRFARAVRSPWALAPSTVVAVVAAAGSSYADDAPPPAPGAGPTCDLSGTSAVAKGVKIFRTAKETNAIATFTGASAPMSMQDIPADPKAERARLSTTERGGTVRIDGFVDATELPLFTTRDIAAVGSQVWIASGQPVKLVQSEPGKLVVEHAIAGTQNQTIRATAPCDAFALEPGVPGSSEVDGHARGFLMKKATVDLYEEPNGKVVFTLKMIEGAGQLFWSTKVSGGFVQVEARGDLVVDAWIRGQDLEPLRPGELRDKYVPPVKQVTGAKLKFEDPPRLVRATTDIPIRAKRETNAPAIGLVDVGAELYVLETIAGWTNVLPRALYVTPADPGGFWIPADEVPTTTIEATP